VSGERDRNVLQDSNISLSGVKSQHDYPRLLRRVRYWDEVNKNELVFITYNRSWTVTTVARIYKERWHIESFFKLIKQNLRIK
jgi:IS4 transposase